MSIGELLQSAVGAQYLYPSLTGGKREVMGGLISETNGFGIVLCEPATKRGAPMLFGSSSPFLKLFELGTRYLQNISLAE